MSVDFLETMRKRITESVKPYPGLRPFETVDSPYFFGRENQVNELVSLLRTTRFLSVIGSSGSGKSSLIKAGLLPRLHKGLMSGDGAHWNVCLMRPGNSPMGALSNSLMQLKDSIIKPSTSFENPSDLNERINSQESFDKEWLEETLSFNSQGLVNAYNFLNLKGKLLIIVDQFEELFRYKESNEQHSSMAKAFVDRLIYASKNEETNIYVCITMRSDFMGNCSDFFDLPETIGKGFYLVPKMSRDELKSAIINPAKLTGATVDPILVEKLANEVEDRQDQLPLLQHALMRTYQIWKKENPTSQGMITLKEYEASGGMKNALSNHANDILRKVAAQGGDRSLDITKRIFQSITKGDGKLGIRRPVKLDVIFRSIKDDSITLEEIKKIINFFRDKDNSLLMPPKGEPLTSDTVIDISHESLMRNWDKLKDWIEEEGENFRVYRKLLDAYSENKDEQRYLSFGRAKYFHQWEKKFKPTTTWANRYGGNFAGAISFLNKNYNKKKWIRVGTLLFTFVAVIGSLFIFVKSNKHLSELMDYYKHENQSKEYLRTGNNKSSFLLADSTLNDLDDFADGFGNTIYNVKNKIFANRITRRLLGTTIINLNTEALKSSLSNSLVQSYNASAFHDFERKNVIDYRLIPGTEEAILVLQKDSFLHINLNTLKPIGEKWKIDLESGYKLRNIVFANKNKKAVAFIYANDRNSQVKVYNLHDDSHHDLILDEKRFSYVSEIRFESKQNFFVIKTSEDKEYLYYFKNDKLLPQERYNGYDLPKSKRSTYLQNHKAFRFLKFSKNGNKILAQVDSLTVDEIGFDQGITLISDNWKIINQKNYPNLTASNILSTDWVLVFSEDDSFPARLFNMDREKFYKILPKINAKKYDIPNSLIDDKYLVFKDKKVSTNLNIPLKTILQTTLIYDLSSLDKPEQVTDLEKKEEILYKKNKGEKIDDAFYKNLDGAGFPLKGSFKQLSLKNSILLGLNNQQEFRIWNIKSIPGSIFAKKDKKINQLLIDNNNIYGRQKNTLLSWSNDEKTPQLRQEYPLDKRIRNLHFSKNNNLVFGWDQDNNFLLGKKDSFDLKVQPKHKNLIHFDIHSNHKEAVYLNDRNQIKLVAMEEDKDGLLKLEKTKLKTKISTPIEQLKFLNNQDLFITSLQNKLHLWILTDEDILIQDSIIFESPITSIRIHSPASDSDKNFIYLGCADGTLYQYYLNPTKQLAEITAINLSKTPITDIDISSNGAIAATDGKLLHFLEKKKDEPGFEISNQTVGDTEFLEISFSKRPDEPYSVYTLFESGIIQKWNFNREALRKTVN